MSDHTFIPGVGWVHASQIAQQQARGHQGGGHGGGYGAPPNMPPQPWPPGPDARPDLNNQTYQSLAARPGMMWSIESVADPRPLIPVSKDGTVAMVYRTRTIRFTGIAAGQVGVSTLQFDEPTALYARFGSVFTDAQLTDFQAANPLALFDVQFTRGATGDLLDVDFAAATNVLGTAQRPAYIGGRAWQFDNGNSVTIAIRPRLIDLDIDITVWYVSFPGPDNYVAAGGGQ